MKIYALTSNAFKFQEISKYFSDMGITTQNVTDFNDILQRNFILIYEQTSLLDQNLIPIASQNTSTNAIHQSTLTFHVFQQKECVFTEKFVSQVHGFVFPHSKTQRTDVYSWDDIFYPENSQLSYQDMKDNGVKTSARDLNFSKMFEHPSVQEWISVKFEEKVNLSFNPIEKNDVVNFDPVVYNLLQHNSVYQLAYKNEIFNPLLNKVLNDGLFTRRAENRQQKNYWLPGVNAGIPLTPKKDTIHELTFMFHDIMHFVFPDILVDNDSVIDQKIYIVSRMMSEAFTLTLADMLFIHLLKQGQVQYDFHKRRIYPLFEHSAFDITAGNLPKIKDVLRAVYQFALQGNENELIKLSKNTEAFESFKNKYQPFFTEDYIWTANNFKYLTTNNHSFNQWLHTVKKHSLNPIVTTTDLRNQYNIQATDDIFTIIFEHFFNLLETTVTTNTPYDETLSLKNAFLRYMSGQIMVFYKYSSNHNDLFLKNILASLHSIQHETTIEGIQSLIEDTLKIYTMYLDYLLKMDLITAYKAEQYKNIFPLFDPFYVFYDANAKHSFHTTYLNIFGEPHDTV